ncbi:polysaccharide pyruvyl transferase family protein [Microbacterium ginsengiterrae]
MRVRAEVGEESVKTLIRAGKHPAQVLGPEAAFQRGVNGVFGANSGNLLFSNAVFRTLSVPGAELVPDSFTTERAGVDDDHVTRINDEFDNFVIPLANAFRPEFLPALNKLSSVIERLDIPVAVVGVGAQLSNGNGTEVSDLPSTLKEPVTRFVSAVLDRSAKIGVRGDFTREFLARLGFGDDHVEIIGCPSLTESAEYRVEKKAERLTRESRISFNAVPSLEVIGEVFQEHSERFPNITYVQQEYRELALLMWGQPMRGRVATAFPSGIDHPLYREDRLVFFLDPQPWQQFLSTMDFSFGNRIHGNIAALAAGTPAVVISHDSRTRELAEYHRIPTRSMPDRADEIRAEALYDNADFGPFHDAQAENFARYVRFLDANDIRHVHAAGATNAGTDATADGVDFGQGVRSLLSGDNEAIVRRLNWLWRGTESGRLPREAIYIPPFAPHSDDSYRRTLSAELDSAIKEARKKDRELAELKGSVEELSLAVQELHRWSTRRFAVIPERSLLRRGARMVRRVMKRGK